MKKIGNDYVILGEDAILIVHSIKYGDKIYFIDVEDAEKCKTINWCVNKIQRKGSDQDAYYYLISTGEKPSRQFHRFIVNAKKGEVVDHINGDEYDNRKSNLRICTKSENNINRKLNKNNKSGRKGIIWDKTNKKWMAYISYKAKDITLGHFEDINSAIACREEAEQKYFGEFLRPINYDSIK